MSTVSRFGLHVPSFSPAPVISVSRCSSTASEVGRSLTPSSRTLLGSRSCEFHPQRPPHLLITAWTDGNAPTHLHSFFFFGGLSIPLSQALLAHLFSYNITWGATKKEVERSNFWQEVPKIFERFRISLAISFAAAIAMIILTTDIVPIGWRIFSWDWAVIVPLAYVFHPVHQRCGMRGGWLMWRFIHSICSIVAGCHILYPVRDRTRSIAVASH